MGSNDFAEIKVSIKDDEQKLVKNYTHYGNIQVSHDNPDLRKMVDQTIADFKGNKNECDVVVKIKYIW